MPDHREALLTEFSSTLTTSESRSDRLPKIGAGVVLVGAIVAIALGHFARANGLVAKVNAEYLGGSEPASSRLEFGYLIELSHALFYVVLAPVFVYFALRFVLDCSRVLHHFVAIQRLRHDPTEAIGKSNRRFFRPVIFILPALAIVLNLWQETKLYLEAADGHPRLGYMQAPYFKAWEAKVNGHTGSDPLAPIEGTKLEGELEAEIRQSLQRLAASDDEDLKKRCLDPWIPYLDRTGPADVTLSRTKVAKGEFTVNLCRAMESQGTPGAPALITKLSATVMNSGHANGSWEEPDRFGRILHGVFGVYVVAYESTFHAFAAWIILKVIFVFRTVYKLLPKNKHDTIGKFRLLFQDDAYRYGLSDLSNPYNTVVTMVLIGAAVFAMNYMSNAQKNMFVLPSGETSPYVGQVLIPVGVFVAAGAVLVGPVRLFGRRVRALRNEEIDRLNILRSQAIAAGDIERERELQEEIRIVKAQSMWPYDDPGFKRLALVGLCFALIPVLLWVNLRIGFLPDSVAKLINVLRLSEECLVKLSRFFGEIP